MKTIKYLFYMLTVCLFLGCTENDDRPFNNTEGRFARFFMLVNSNNEVLEFPKTNNGLQPVSNYTKNTIKTLKIPVALTTEPLTNNVTVNYETLLTGLNGVTIAPENNVTFTPTKLIDTITVTFTERWDVTNNPQLKLTLLSANDPNINIGMPNTNTPNNELTVNFDTLNFTYRFPSPNQQEIIGTTGETASFYVEFPNGYINSEVDGIDLFNETSSSFDYTLTQLPLTNPTQINYSIIVNNNIEVDELEFKTIFELNDLQNYTTNGSTNYTIKKPIVTIRDNSVFTSNNFYDLSNPFHRTYGEHWFDFNQDNVCTWQSFFAFTFPVVVSSDHPNAVLYDDMGTANVDDDIYHHAFKIGFNSTNSTGTTNSFDLRRWFNNESSNQSASPGFNITEALEFFPTNGASTTGGFVQVIEQDILISSNTGTQHIIAISGNGTYNEIEPGLFEILLEFRATNEVLFGGTRTDNYRIYNNNSYTNPADLTETCKVPLAL